MMFATMFATIFATIFAIAILAIQPLAAAPSPQNISQLKSLEQKVTGVVQKVLPATISLFSTKSGASGSGVVVSKDGLILTAGHVVRGSDEMTVVFPNGKQATGKVLGANYTRDTAMIQIMDPKPTFGWPHAGIGKSRKLDSGDLVIALGHAGGYDPVRTPPVRFGRVIAQGQDHFLNTDCTLIGGDSGGPLFDLNGKRRRYPLIDWRLSFLQQPRWHHWCSARLGETQKRGNLGQPWGKLAVGQPRCSGHWHHHRPTKQIRY